MRSIPLEVKITATDTFTVRGAHKYVIQIKFTKHIDNTITEALLISFYIK
jgi:hypothetical protein